MAKPIRIVADVELSEGMSLGDLTGAVERVRAELERLGKCAVRVKIGSHVLGDAPKQ